MKKFVYILIIVLSNTNTFSQEKDTLKENYLGIGGGLTMYSIVTETDFVYEGYFDYKNVDAYFFYNNNRTAGISYKHFSEKFVGLVLELNYIKKGGYNVFIFDSDNNSIDTTAVLFKHDLEYVELPFMMNIRFGKKKLKFNLYAGPHISYLFKEEITFLSDTYGKQYKTGADLKFEFGINGGGGISYQFGKNIVELGMRYSQGLTGIFNYLSINNAILNQNQVISGRFNYYYIF